MDKSKSRRKDFKKTFGDPRRRREDNTVQIRKVDRDAQVSQKRAMLASTPNASGLSLSLQEATVYAMSDDPAKQMLAAQQLRRSLAVDTDPPIEQVIATGIVPRLIEFLRDFTRPGLQLEAAWTITNIASGSKDQTQVATDAGAIPIFVDLLSSDNEDVRDQAVWGLGNIAGDCAWCRDMVLQAGALKPLLSQIHENKKILNLRNASWALSNLCRGSPQPNFDDVVEALPTLRQLVYNTDKEILADCTWAISYLLDTRVESRIDQIIGTGICTRLVELLTHPEPTVHNPALRSIGQIIAGTHRQTEVAIQSGALRPLRVLLSNSKTAVRKETCWVLSNIAAGTVNQIQALITYGLMDPLIQLLSKGDLEIKRECAWALSNAVIGGTPQQIDHIVNLGCIKPLCDLLSVREKNIVSIALEALDCILAVGKNAKETNNLAENPYIQLIEEADGFLQLEKLQLTEETGDIYRQTMRILNTYFELHDQIEDQDDN